MKRFFAPLVAALLVLAIAPAQAVDEGIDYQVIEPPQPTATPDKVEVIEVFWYGCPSCFAFKPFLSAWAEQKPEHVELVRLPAPLNPNWQPHARAYYAAELLGVVERVHTPMFDAIHLDNRRLDNEDALAEFFAEHGVDEQEFRKAYRSFAVETKLRRAGALAQRFGVTGVPAMVVEGKYRTDGGMAGGFANVIKVIDHLVEKEGARLVGGGS